MKNKIRKTVSGIWFIHLMSFLGLFALWGYIELYNKYLILFVALSFLGATCGSFIRVIDAINNKQYE